MSVNSISSSTVSSILQNTVTRLQSQLTTTSSESSTGLLADIGFSLGANSGQDVALHQQMADLTALTGSNAVVTAQLGSASAALTSLSSTTQTMLEQIIQNQSETPGSNGALALQQTAATALSTFSSLMNTSSGGVYVFGGVNSGVAPLAAYVQTPAGAAQTTVDAAFQSSFGFPVTSASVSTISGAAMASFLNTQFAGLFSGASWTSAWSSASDTRDEQSHRRQPDGDDLDQRQSSGLPEHGAGPDHAQRIRWPEPLLGRHGGADDRGAENHDLRQ